LKKHWAKPFVNALAVGMTEDIVFKKIGGNDGTYIVGIPNPDSCTPVGPTSGCNCYPVTPK
jgi:hypothetical protein